MGHRVDARRRAGGARRAVTTALLVLAAPILASPVLAGPSSGAALVARVSHVPPAVTVTRVDGTARASGTRTWPGGRVTYADRSRDRRAVRLAVRAWNRSGIRVRFVRAKQPREAQLVIRNDPRRSCGSGIATMGYTTQARVELGGLDQDGDPCPWPGLALTATHELGHVLGLRHIPESTCAVMNPTTINGVAPTGCLAPGQEAKPGRWWCQMLARPDLVRAKRLYGGTVREALPEWCDAYQMIPQTGPVTAVRASPSGNGLRLTLVRGDEPVVPGWVLKDPYYARDPGVEIHVGFQGCPATPGDVDTRTWSASWGDVPVGGTLELLVFVDGYPVAGQTCVAAWQYDAGYNYGTLPATTLVQPSPPEPGQGAS